RSHIFHHQLFRSSPLFAQHCAHASPLLRSDIVIDRDIGLQPGRPAFNYSNQFCGSPPFTSRTESLISPIVLPSASARHSICCTVFTSVFGDSSRTCAK